MTGSATSTARFISIPLSHYCEKARWALDRVALPYHEEAHVPLLHRLATMRHHGGSVPMLVQGSTRFTDSSSILRHADSIGSGERLYPLDDARRAEVDTWVLRFDEELGPHVRRWAYGHLLGDTELVRDLWSVGVERWEAGFVPVILPIARRLIRKGYGVTAASALRSLERVHRILSLVDQRLREGRRFLVGECFTAADLTFAALAAPALFPVGCRAALPALERVPAAMRGEIMRLRDSPAGVFVQRLYSEERTSRPSITMNAKTAYKVLTATEWTALEADKFYGAPIDRTDGFIHLSTAAQLTETVDRHFSGREGLIIAAIDLMALGDSVRWEPSRHGQLFPHVYAPLVRDVVRSWGPMERGADGSVRLPD
jgi:glutathione S-transferase